MRAQSDFPVATIALARQHLVKALTPDVPLGARLFHARAGAIFTSALLHKVMSLRTNILSTLSLVNDVLAEITGIQVKPPENRGDMSRWFRELIKRRENENIYEWVERVAYTCLALVAVASTVMPLRASLAFLEEELLGEDLLEQHTLSQ